MSPGAGSELVSSQVLASGSVAAWWRSPWIPGGLTLDIDGAEQSTLFPNEPERVLYDYLMWMQASLRMFGIAPDAGAGPATTLHLGGGALSLPRALTVADPDSRHVVVDLDPDLIDAVLEQVPFPVEPLPNVVAGDVREALPLAVKAAAGPVVCVVLDIALEPDSPDRLFETSYASELLDAVVPGGLVLINVGDEPGLHATQRMTHALAEAGAEYFAAADSSLFSLTQPGNLVLVARRCGNGGASTGDVGRCDPGAAFDEGALRHLESIGPHPGTVMSSQQLAELLGPLKKKGKQ